ncbi:MAG: class D beta-lactamase [Epsilonproteobacteria bacterium]|nr:class D beta-lactamase [Campylobacterota bacterium]
MVKKVYRLLLIISFLGASLVSASDKDITNIFEKHQVEGTLVITSLDTNISHIHNSDRAKKQFIPASTFKIPNTLIALEEGVIKDEDEIIKWDGKNREYLAWNQDQTLATAFSHSCIWCYQHFAKAIGKERYRYYLHRLNYGNQKIDDALTSFWLEGSFAISAQEQIGFLRKVYLETLPFKREYFKILKKIMLVEQIATYRLYAKTGWSGKVGWYVGYLESKGQVWLFASNIQVNNTVDLKFRKQLVLEAFKVKKII